MGFPSSHGIIGGCYTGWNFDKIIGKDKKDDNKKEIEKYSLEYTNEDIIRELKYMNNKIDLIADDMKIIKNK